MEPGRALATARHIECDKSTLAEVLPFSFGSFYFEVTASCQTERMSSLFSELLWKAVSPLPSLSRLEAVVRADQLAATRRLILSAIPINVVLGLTCLAVAIHGGHAKGGAFWFAASTAVNAARVGLARLGGLGRLPLEMSVERQLALSSALALLSGLVWSLVALLCAGYTSPHTLFFLIVVCGICAGAVTYGTAYSPVPIAFVTPPLLSVAACLFYQRAFDSVCLGGAVVLYLFALVRSTLQTEAAFRETSRLKNEATASAVALREAHEVSSKAAQEMGRLALYDSLTGALNRVGFLQEMEARSKGRSQLCLMLLDLDGFKSINDVYGHHAGDGVLKEVARRLRATLDNRFVIARLGGDEFAILHSVGEQDRSLADLARQIIDVIGTPFEGLGACRVGASIGIYVHTAQGAKSAELLACADQALYAAKLSGRNRHCLFDDALRARAAQRRDLERDLAAALDAGDIELWHQPIFGRSGRTLAGFEGLLRWRHPVHGWIAPELLVTTAAMTGFAEPLLRFVVGEATAMAARIRGLGLVELRIAMNVSARDMAQFAVDDLVLEALRARDVPTSMFELEITEETALDIEKVQQKLANLAQLGVSIAIDDFGVGYSSLASLRHGRVRRVKIDRSFISGIGESGELALVRAILTLSRSLNLEVVAEGVETAEDLRALQGEGCQFLQGYHLGHPRPMDAAIEFARTFQPRRAAGASGTGSAPSAA